MSKIRNVQVADAEAICTIYNYYIENTVITFEELSVSILDMEKRIMTITEEYPWLVYEEDGVILGYAYANSWKNRSAYRYAAECSVYLARESTGKGIGSKLYQALIDQLSPNFHNLIGGIALPNAASVALHEKFGFKKVAHFKEIGWKQERWIDVGYWELITDNKSFVISKQ